MANVVKYVPAGSSYNPYTDSDVGTVVSYNSSTGRVEFKDIDFNALGALLGLTKPFTFKDCVLSPNVNPNAIFKPSTSAPYTLADFAGYQHVTRYYFPLTHTATNPVSSYYTAHEYEFVPYDGLYFNEPPINFSNLFNGSSINDPDLALWNVSNVTNMYNMFVSASAFNQDIGGWNVSAVTNTSGMFGGAFAFNRNIGLWDVGNVTDMSIMFNGATSFNQDIGSWDTSKVTNMNYMFQNAFTFNRNIGLWNTSGVTSMSGMFAYAGAFNQDLSLWCVSKISTRPSAFDSGANAWVLPRPVWGTCPRGENL